MWTAQDHPRQDQHRLRYPSDMTDEEWALIAPLIPPARRGGRRRSIDLREVVNGILYVLTTGSQWGSVPKHFPAKSTLYSYFDLWTYEGVIDRIHHALYDDADEMPDRKAGPTAGVIDPASRRTAEKGGSRSTRMVPMQERRSRARHQLSWSVRRMR